MGANNAVTTEVANTTDANDAVADGCFNNAVAYGVANTAVAYGVGNNAVTNGGATKGWASLTCQQAGMGAPAR